MGNIIVYDEEDKYPARRVLYKKKNSIIVWRDNWAHRKMLEIFPEGTLGQVVSRKRNNNTLSRDAMSWKLLTIWAFIRYVPGLVINYLGRLKYYLTRLFR